MDLKTITIIFMVAVIAGILLWWLIKSANKQAREGGFNKKE